MRHGAHPEDELVQIAYAKDAFEGQMIAGLLESEGIASLQFVGLRGNQVARAAAPGERGDGPRRVMVGAAAAARALAVIERRLSEVDEGEAPEAPEPSESRYRDWGH
jgi:hypothetical protein